MPFGGALVAPSESGDMGLCQEGRSGEEMNAIQTLSRAPPDQWGCLLEALGAHLVPAESRLDGSNMGAQQPAPCTVTSILNLMEKRSADTTACAGQGINSKVRHVPASVPMQSAAPSCGGGITGRLRRGGRRGRTGHAAPLPRAPAEADTRDLEELLRDLGEKPAAAPTKATPAKAKKKSKTGTSKRLGALDSILVSASALEADEDVEAVNAAEAEADVEEDEADEDVEAVNAAEAEADVEEDEADEDIEAVEAPEAEADVEEDPHDASFDKQRNAGPETRTTLEAEVATLVTPPSPVESSPAKPIKLIASSCNAGLRSLSVGHLPQACQTSVAQSVRGRSSEQKDLIYCAQPSVGTWLAPPPPSLQRPSHSSTAASPSVDAEAGTATAASSAGTEAVGTSGSSSKDVMFEAAARQGGSSNERMQWHVLQSVGTWLRPASETPSQRRSPSRREASTARSVASLQLWPPTPESTPPSSPRSPLFATAPAGAVVSTAQCGGGFAHADAIQANAIGSAQVVWVPVPVPLLGEVQQVLYRGASLA
eukprot:TRINITY_DN12103_c0_g1_i2.p1 TRINITY_DN12103_c0_g1~~TRINITY_DN12103_c0_g1_i2.p1  ORF type:complete len:567 (+),score=136.68 TRINITY_DN12103_c0_g1_i2:81-1703(+)